MKKLAAVAVVAFAITLAVIVGTRMSSEAMAVVIGVVCGVAAGIPTSLLIVAVTNRKREKRDRSQVERDYPPVVVIQPGQGGSAHSSPYLPPMPSTAGPRQFHVVGEEKTEEVPLA
ncbi:MAG: hypothetical protein U9Q78_05585 [Chloroflexota bacterium]|nr:hypothetical protein [Chloroflexota bacterium]